jgi:hypothetical protein
VWELYWSSASSSAASFEVVRLEERYGLYGDVDVVEDDDVGFGGGRGGAFGSAKDSIRFGVPNGFAEEVPE